MCLTPFNYRRCLSPCLRKLPIVNFSQEGLFLIYKNVTLFAPFKLLLIFYILQNAYWKYKDFASFQFAHLHFRLITARFFSEEYCFYTVRCCANLSLFQNEKENENQFFTFLSVLLCYTETDVWFVYLCNIHTVYQITRKITLVTEFPQPSHWTLMYRLGVVKS